MGQISENLRFGNVTVDSLDVKTGTITNAMCHDSMGLARTKLELNSLAEYNIDFASLRVWDALNTPLTGSPGTDDMGLLTGVFGTESWHLSAGDLKAAGDTSRYCRGMVALPQEYDAAETVQFEITAATQDNVADVSSVVDIEVYSFDEDLTVSADLVTTAATSINAVTFAAKTFLVTSTSLNPGDILDFRIKLQCNDAATGANVEPTISAIKLQCDVRG